MIFNQQELEVEKSRNLTVKYTQISRRNLLSSIAEERKRERARFGY